MRIRRRMSQTQPDLGGARDESSSRPSGHGGVNTPGTHLVTSHLASYTYPVRPGDPPGSVRDRSEQMIGERSPAWGDVCVIPFYTRKRVPSTPHDYESTPVEPLRHVGIVSTTEARSLNVLKRALRMDSGRGGSAGRGWTKADSTPGQGRASSELAHYQGLEG